MPGAGAPIDPLRAMPGSDGDKAASGFIDGAEYEVVRPDPVGTIKSLAALGYSPEAAIADIIDNSLAHGARHIGVEARWDGAAESWVAIIDDGAGMDETTLVRGLTLGARNADARGEADLGRFGMGLKTASFSQARQLVVASRTESSPWNVRAWDIDHVLAVRDWQLLRGCPPEAAPTLAKLQQDVGSSGTIVLWRRLTRLAAIDSRAGDGAARREFHIQTERIERHVGMVFSRYLSGSTKSVEMRLNGRSVASWDPTLPGYPHVERLPSETPLPGVRVQGFILPHRSRLTEEQVLAGAGPRGWLDQQGFYIYRRDRLIVAGDWLNLGRLRKDEKHVLARIVVDLPTDQDFAWALDVKKSTATPPPSLAGHLLRVAKATRERASAVISHRGRVVRDTRSEPEDFTWRVVSRYGEQRFLINRDHPLVSDLLQRHPDARDDLRAVLAMVEQTLPVGTIRTTPEATAQARDPGDNVPPEVVELARRVLNSLLARRIPPQQAALRVARMPPFSDYPGIAEQLSAAEDEREPLHGHIHR